MHVDTWDRLNPSSKLNQFILLQTMFSNLEFSIHTSLAIVVLIFQRWSLRFRQILGKAKTPPNYAEGVDMSNQIVVITGANAGIGRATAKRLATCGATVVLGCRDIQKGIEASQEINMYLATLAVDIFPYASQGRAVFMRLDLADLSSVLDFSNRLKVEFPRIDILVNNAGLNMKGMLSTGIEQLFQVNYLGHYLLLRCLQTHLTSRDMGKTDHPVPATARVINLSSVMHHTGQPNFVASSLGTYSLLMQAKASYYADSKLYMHYLTMEVNRRFDTAKEYRLQSQFQSQFQSSQAPSQQSLSSGGGSSSSTSLDREAHGGQQALSMRPVVSLSVNPGAVRSEIWRDYPFQSLYNALMKLVFLEVEEGCASSVFAATVDLSQIRAYQAEHRAAQDVGGRFTLRPDVPYAIPYHVRVGFLAQEILGVYAGCEFGGVTLPTEAEVSYSGLDEAAPWSSLTTAGGSSSGSSCVGNGRQPSQQARRLWAYSAQLCHKTLLQLGAKESEVKFLLG